MKYIIVSDKVGDPGAEFVPQEGVNVEALLEGGFIEPSSAPKSAAKRKITEEKE